MTYRDMNDPGNATRWRTGKPCVERGCRDPAGTAWSPHWCPAHNIERIDRISTALESIAKAGKGGT